MRANFFLAFFLPCLPSPLRLDFFVWAVGKLEKNTDIFFLVPTFKTHIAGDPKLFVFARRKQNTVSPHALLLCSKKIFLKFFSSSKNFVSSQGSGSENFYSKKKFYEKIFCSLRNLFLYEKKNFWSRFCFIKFFSLTKNRDMKSF